MSQKMATQQLRLNTLSTSNSIYEYPLENTITKLNYAFWKDGKLYIRGENLTPYYGTVKITPFTQANTQYHHLHGQDILSATDTELVFKAKDYYRVGDTILVDLNFQHLTLNIGEYRG